MSMLITMLLLLQSRYYKYVLKLKASFEPSGPYGLSLVSDDRLNNMTAYCQLTSSTSTGVAYQITLSQYNSEYSLGCSILKPDLSWASPNFSSGPILFQGVK